MTRSFGLDAASAAEALQTAVKRFGGDGPHEDPARDAPSRRSPYATTHGKRPDPSPRLQARATVARDPCAESGGPARSRPRRRTFPRFSKWYFKR